MGILIYLHTLLHLRLLLYALSADLDVVALLQTQLAHVPALRVQILLELLVLGHDRVLPDVRDEEYGKERAE